MYSTPSPIIVAVSEKSRESRAQEVTVCVCCECCVCCVCAHTRTFCGAGAVLWAVAPKPLYSKMWPFKSRHYSLDQKMEIKKTTIHFTGIL